MTPSTAKILVINGHPDPSPERFCAALAGAYLRGASRAGHLIRRVDVGALALPPLSSQAEFTGEVSPEVKAVQTQVVWADHLVVIYPLWLGGPPAMLKAFFEQVFRPDFALGGQGRSMKALLKGRSARVIVTMGMPAVIFRLVFGAAGLTSVTRGLLAISGIRPVRSTVIGAVVGAAAARERQLRAADRLGAAAR